MFKIGCAEKMLEVPLFVELYGYGPFQGRRNQGILDPLYTRAFSFFDGEKRFLVVYTDIGSTPEDYARELRKYFAEKYDLDPAGITFIATHTHSAPKLSFKGASAFGTPDPEFQEIWKNAVKEVVEKALSSEEEIEKAYAGKAPLSEKIGVNRIDGESNTTDPAIRWVKFMKKDGSCKVLLHNHGVHGICCNMGLSRLVSADWMGGANAQIKEKNLCEMPLFFQGACGDINTARSFHSTQDRNIARTLTASYVSDLANDLEKGEEIELGKFSFAFKTVEFPTIKQDAASLRKDAELFRTKGGGFWNEIAYRLEEMAILIDKGIGIAPSCHDLQLVQLGKELSFFFVPGELFIKPALEILEGSKAKFPFIMTYANGNVGYLFTEEVSKRYPTIDCHQDQMFGYYEIYGYMQSHRFKYQDNIANFVVTTLKEMEK